jgi:transcriptional regulator with XRE-family HTH domain
MTRTTYHPVLASMVGMAIRSHLDLLGKSQEWLSHQLCIDSGTVSRWIRGVHSPSLESLFLVAEALDVHISSIFDEIDRESVGRVLRGEY